MKSWVYTIDIKKYWEKYSELSHEDFDNDPDIFHEMKKEITQALKTEMAPPHVAEAKEIIGALEKSKHLSSFNNHWNKLYDYCDYKRIWLKTDF